jgi:putative membrane protein
MKRLALQEFKWFLLLLSYTLFLFTLLITNKLFDYLHPRMLPFVIFACIVLFICTLFHIQFILRGKERPLFQKGFLIFFIPLLCIFAARRYDVTTSLASSRGNVGQSAFPGGSTYRQEEIDRLLAQPVVTIDDRHYFRYFHIIHYYVSAFIGKEIEVTGFIYREETFDENRFLAGRLVTYCCAADSFLTGFVCDMAGAKNLDPDKWIKVRGSIDKLPYYNEKNEPVILPKITVYTIEYIQPPRIPLIFPD